MVVTTTTVSEVQDQVEVIKFMMIADYRVLIAYNYECRELVRWLCAALSAIMGFAISINKSNGSRPWWGSVLFFANAGVVFCSGAQHRSILQRAKNEVALLIRDVLAGIFDTKIPAGGKICLETNTFLVAVYS